MKKYNKLEIIGFTLLVFGGLFWASEEFFLIEALAPIYSISRVVLWLGVVIWALGYNQREKAGKIKSPIK